MQIAPISYRTKAILNNFKMQNKFVSFKGNSDTFVRETKEPEVAKEEIEKAQEIFEEAGMYCFTDEKTGLLQISQYNKDVKKVLEKHQGITENDLFKTVVEIFGDANFSNTEVDDLGNLEKIGGTAHFGNSNVKNLGNLKYIRHFADFEYSKIESLGNLEIIGDDAYFKGSKIKDLGKLEIIRGDADFEDSNVEDLGKLKYIKGNANFKHSKVKNLGDLEFIGGVAYINDSPLTLNNFSGMDCFVDNNP